MRDAPGPNSSNLVQFWGKIGKIVCWRVGAPAWGKFLICHWDGLCSLRGEGMEWQDNDFIHVSCYWIFYRKVMEFQIKNPVKLQYMFRCYKCIYGIEALVVVQVFGKILKIICWCSPRRVGAPPWGNPGSTTRKANVHGRGWGGVICFVSSDWRDNNFIQIINYILILILNML